MSVTYISAAVRRLVIERAGERCEYCLMPAIASFIPHEVDHIIAEKHGGPTDALNLAYTCWRCNRHKGSDLGSFDPDTHNFALRYHPRTQKWQTHFVLQHTQVIGLTAEGRTTVWLLQINSADRIAERKALLDSGVSFAAPPDRT